MILLHGLKVSSPFGASLVCIIFTMVGGVCMHGMKKKTMFFVLFGFGLMLFYYLSKSFEAYPIFFSK